jgi:ketosteroid isomerase-like protein
MSQENIEVVKAASPPTGTELTALFADDAGAPKRLEAAAPLFHPEFEFEVHSGVGERLRGKGLDQLAASWREWTQPFEVFRTEIEEFIEVDDNRVLVLIRDHVQPKGAASEIESLGCNLWTLRDGKVVRIDFYPTREQGLEAAGLRQ